MHRREASRSTPRARLAVAGLAGLLALAVLGLAQCRLVDDRITGVDLKSSNRLTARSSCVRRCNEDFKRCKETEDALHKSRIDACNRLDSVAARNACKKAELDRHHDAHLACVSSKRLCKNHCYNEGGGSGGR